MNRWIHLANLSMGAVVLYSVKPLQRLWINTLSMAATSKSKSAALKALSSEMDPAEIRLIR
jgi:hypothetical protein